MRIQVTLTNEDEGYVFSEYSEDDTWAETNGELYKSLRSEYGRCISRMYRDREDAVPVTVGWVFEKRNTYDEGGTYLQHAWVEVLPAA